MNVERVRDGYYVQLVREGDEAQSVEFTVWFTPDGTVSTKALMDLIVANLNASQIRGVEGEFRHPFAKEYPYER